MNDKQYYDDVIEGAHSGHDNDVEYERMMEEEKTISTTIKAWNSKITHISEGNGVTRCNRKLADYESDVLIASVNGFKTCSKCGNDQDFGLIYDDIRKRANEREVARLAKIEEGKAIRAARLEEHRNIINELNELLIDFGATTSVDKKPGGTNIDFEVGGLKFSLSGSIWR